MAVEEAGGFLPNTVTEDMDATISVSRAGYRVVYAPKAVAYTEAPQTLRALHGQRERWSFGTLQVLWKHRGAPCRPAMDRWDWRDFRPYGSAPSCSRTFGP
jgi:cellulose synthase/poly-beta-1,6-N-acetylglucosamine synthase-like glycosyltransferase